MDNLLWLIFRSSVAYTRRADVTDRCAARLRDKYGAAPIQTSLGTALGASVTRLGFPA
jgi:hypothetical protein